MSKIKYPIGKYRAKKSISPLEIAHWIDEIKELPHQLQIAIDSLTHTQLDTQYREGSWTLRQVVHHIADSHINGYCRVKLALTENTPTIKPYEQELWAELIDSNGSIESSMGIINGLHRRWSELLKSLDEKQLNRDLIHPEDGTLAVKSLISFYAWHGKHHLAHITSLKERKNWS